MTSHDSLTRLRGIDYRALAPRVALTVLGSVCFAVGNVLNVRANVGQAPWVAFHYGMTLHTPLSLGQANFVFSLFISAVSYKLGVPPGLGTVLGVLVVSYIMDLLLPLVPTMHGWAEGYAMLLVAVLIFTLGTALMVKARLGVGPRDSFMLAMSAITGRRVGVVKTAIDLAALALGTLMGAVFGLGTVVYAVVLGPSVELWFLVLGLKSPKRRAAKERPA